MSFDRLSAEKEASIKTKGAIFNCFNQQDKCWEKFWVYENIEGARDFYCINLSQLKTSGIISLDALVMQVLLTGQCDSDGSGRWVAAVELVVENDDARLYRIFNRFLLISKRSEEVKWEQYAGSRHGFVFTDTSRCGGGIRSSLVLKSNDFRKSPLEDKKRIRRLLISVLESALSQGSEWRVIFACFQTLRDHYVDKCQQREKLVQRCLAYARDAGRLQEWGEVRATFLPSIYGSKGLKNGCAFCFKLTKSSNCSSASYCSPECQRKDSKKQSIRRNSKPQADLKSQS